MEGKIQEDLDRYAELTEWIRELSAPQVAGIRDGASYRTHFVRNYARIRELGRSSRAVISAHIMPLLEKEGRLTEEEREVLLYLSDHLLDAVTMESVDVTLKMNILDRLLTDAKEEGDTALLLRIYDGLVECCYYAMTSAAGFADAADFFTEIQKKGADAAEYIMSFLEKEKFAQLDYASKRIVLVNSRYINALYEFARPPVPQAHNRAHLEILERAIEISKDSFYIGQASKYDWKYHTYRALQGIAHITEYKNACGASDELLKKISAYTRQMLALWKEDRVVYGALSSPEVMHLNLYRNAYLAGEMTTEAYRESLLDLIEGADKEDFTHDGNMNLIFAQTEYMLTLDGKRLTKKQKELVQRFYNNLIIYVHRMPKVGSLIFLISYLSHALDAFIETEGGMTYETLCLEILAAVNPQLYHHSLQTAAIAEFLTRRLYEKDRTLLQELPGYPDIESVADFIRRAALLHDVGKLKVSDLTITYQRSYFPVETAWMQVTPRITASMLSRFESTARFADAALAHHVYYDGSGGYPANVDLSKIRGIAAAHIIGLANDMEGATDEVRFDDVAPMTAAEFAARAKKQSGVRYAPYLTDLLSEEAFLSDLQELLEKESVKSFRRTYELLTDRMKASFETPV